MASASFLIALLPGSISKKLPRYPTMTGWLSVVHVRGNVSLKEGDIDKKFVITYAFSASMKPKES